MAQTAYHIRTAFWNVSAPAAKYIVRAQMPLFQAFLRPSSAKATVRHCIKVATTIDFACGTGGFITSYLNLLNPQTKVELEQRNNAVFGIEKKQFPYILCITNMLLHGVDNPNILHDNALTDDVLDYTDDDKFDVILMNPPYGGTEKADVQGHFPANLRSSETADLFVTLIMYRLKANGRAAVVLPDGFLFGTGNKTEIKKKLFTQFNVHTVVRLPAGAFAPYTSITTNILFFENNTVGTRGTWFYRVDPPKGVERFSKTNPLRKEHLKQAEEWWNNRTEIVDDEGFQKAKRFSLNEIAERGFNLDVCGYPHETEEILTPQELVEELVEKKRQLNETMNKLIDELKTAFNIDLEN